MIGLTSPAWLWLLPLLPLAYWLHRYREQAPRFLTSSLFLWSGHSKTRQAQARRASVSPTWWLRASIILALILALTSPFLESASGIAASVWVDDSISMLARHDGMSRIERAAERLRSYLKQQQVSQITLHRLSTPASGLRLDASQLEDLPAHLGSLLAQSVAEPRPPAPASLSTRQLQVLLTDGADPGVNAWAVDAPLHQVIRSGQSALNLALTRVAIRHQPDIAGGHALSARIDNPGPQAADAIVVVRANGHEIERRPARFPANSYRLIAFNLPVEQDYPIEVQVINQADVLLEDDSLVLLSSAAVMPRQYVQLGNCGPFVDALLRSRPEYIPGPDPDFVIDCQVGAAQSLPTLRLHPVNRSLFTTETTHRAAGIDSTLPALTAGLPYSSEAPMSTADVRAVVSANQHDLVTLSTSSPTTIDSFIDLNHARFARSVEFPLLMRTLLSLVDRQAAADAINQQARPSESARINPLPARPSTGAPWPEPDDRIDLTWFCLLLAAIGVTADLLISLTHRRSTTFGNPGWTR